MSVTSALVTAGRHRRRLLSSASFISKSTNFHPLQNENFLQPLQQSRSYVFLPLSWQDFRERFQRWVESTEHRVVKVQLLSRSKLEQVTKRDKQLWSKIKKKGYPWLLHQTRKMYSIPLPITTTGRKATTVNHFRENYRGWKRRRQEDYRGWKARNKVSFQSWKARQFLKTKQILVKEYSQPEWFDEFGRPLTSRDSTGRFVNPWQSQSTNGIHSLQTLLNWQYQRIKRELEHTGLWNSIKPQLVWDSDTPTLPKPSPPLPTLDRQDTSRIQLTWLGHATCYIQFNGLTILTDPMFSLRAGPYQWAPIGPVREIPPSHSIDELIKNTGNDKIDVCCITHDHFDHLDEGSVLQLKEKVQLWVVPLGLKEWLITTCGVAPESILELEWWEQTQIIKNESSGEVRVVDETTKDRNQSPMKITCCPASHWGSRNMRDRNQRLWCSFALSSNDQNLFICGDTGYPDFPLFRQIGDALGPFDLSAIPIGAYEPADLNKDSHVNPYEAVRVHRDIRSRKSIGIHWGSFRLSEEDMEDPPKHLRQALRESEIDESEFCLLDHGASTESVLLEEQEYIASTGSN